MSADSTFPLILQKYGRKVLVCSADEETGIPGRAFLQPVPERKERGWQRVPTELGIAREERFLYLGDPQISLENMDQGMILCEGTAYDLRSAQPVRIGNRMSHWRAILTVRDEEAL